MRANNKCVQIFESTLNGIAKLVLCKIMWKKSPYKAMWKNSLCLHQIWDQVLTALRKTNNAELTIETIANGHGPLLRGHAAELIGQSLQQQNVTHHR